MLYWSLFYSFYSHMICDLPSVSCPSHPLPFSFSSGFLCSVFLSGDVWVQCQFMLDSGGRFQQVKEKHQERFLPTEFHYQDGMKSWMVSMKMGSCRLAGIQLNVCSNWRRTVYSFSEASHRSSL